MKRRWRLFVFLGCVLVGIAIWPVLSEREPSYQGKSLSEWLAVDDPIRIRDSASTNVFPSPQVAQAVRAMGTNCLPQLLAWFAYKPPHWKAKALALAPRLPPVLSDPTVRYLRDERTKYLQAEEGFAILGPEARSAVPELALLINTTNFSGPTVALIYALGHAGKSAFPILAGVVTNRENHFVTRSAATFAIGYISDFGGDTKEPVLLLVRCLKDEDQSVATSAAGALGRLAVEPVIAVPALTRALQNPDSFVRRFSAAALAAFGERAQSAAPALRKALADTHPEVAEEAASALREISPTPAEGSSSAESSFRIREPGP